MNVHHSQQTPARRRTTIAAVLLLAAAAVLVPASGMAQSQQIKNVIVIYQENWSFDSLYGRFPGANGIDNASALSLTQLDRLTGQPYTSQLGQPFDLVSGSATLTTPPQPLNGGKIDTRFPANFDTLTPFDVVSDAGLQTSDKTGDIVHRYWHEQSQINHGAMNKFVTWSDNPGLVMSYFDATSLPEGLLAQQYTLCDNFFHASFGGSFLNHQFLIAAAPPVYPHAPASMQATLDASGELALDPTTGKIVHDGNITPIGGQSFILPSRKFEKNYAVNTIFSANLTPINTSPTSAALLPSQNDSNPKDKTRPYIPTIGDKLSAKNVSWKWYSGGWDDALISSPSNPANNGQTPPNPPVDPLFQWHHQPFAYYDNYAPWVNGQVNPVSAAHLQDEKNFFADVQNGALPSVSFIKPIGEDNEHPGYADLLRGQQHVADIVAAVQASPYWSQTLIVVTYDEHGGRWDHVPPPVKGLWGDGSRVPAIVIGPFAKPGYIDHQAHDTLSILKTIEKIYGLSPLNDYDSSANTLGSALTHGINPK